MTPDAFREAAAARMTEAMLQARVTQLAKVLGWLGYHTHDSRRSEPGFPDLVLLHPGDGVVIYRELKSHKGRTTPDQKRWLDALTRARQDAAIWRPIDLLDGTVERTLRRQK